MKLYQKIPFIILLSTTLSLILCAGAIAEDAPPQDATQTAKSPNTPVAMDAADDQWHLSLTPYLWFAGLQGTTGNRGHYVSIHASPGDLLSNFNIGLMGAVEARKGPWFVASDLMWIRLSDTKTLPFTEGAGTTARVGATQFFIAPEVGGRLLDAEHMKFDMYTGVRIWHLGQSLSFDPSILGLNPSSGHTWVDPLIGARMRFPLGKEKKLVATAISDLALFGVGAQTSYQFVGDLGYQLNPKWNLRAGYRYMKIDYVQNLYVYNVIQSGAIIGATYTLK
jgi:hypothetical protein